MRHSRRARERAKKHTRRYQLLKRVVNDKYTTRALDYDAVMHRGHMYTANELFRLDLTRQHFYGVGRRVFKDCDSSRAVRKKWRKMDPGREAHRRWFRQFEKRWEVAEDQRIAWELRRQRIRHTDNFIAVRNPDSGVNRPLTPEMLRKLHG